MAAGLEPRASLCDELSEMKTCVVFSPILFHMIDSLRPLGLLLKKAAHEESF